MREIPELNHDERDKLKERQRLISPFWIDNIERDSNSLLSKTAKELLEDVFNIPIGAFSAVATYNEDGQEKRIFISPIHCIQNEGREIKVTMDGVIAEQFTNYRHVVKRLNNIGPITNKDPREKYDGDIDVLIEKTRNDLKRFKVAVSKEWQELEKRKQSGEISELGYKKATRLLEDAQEIYKILIKELELKKRGFEFLGEGEITGEEVGAFFLEANIQLEIKYLPGGGFVILRGYVHDGIWQENFGDDRFQDFGLANIYANTQYVAIEGCVEKQLGCSLPLFWKCDYFEHYGRLMIELVNSGFNGLFLELDSRYQGENYELSFYTYEGETYIPPLFSSIMKKRVMTNEQMCKLFDYISRYNTSFAERVANQDTFMRLFTMQRITGKNSFADREEQHGLSIVKDGTLYINTASVGNNMSTSSVPTGFEFGQMAFVDALSVIKILIMNEAVQAGDLEPGIIVDFQGAHHSHYKSFFFDNPGHAMEIVLTNLHELLAHHPDVKDINDVLDKLSKLDKDTWLWAFDFISKIPFAKIGEPTFFKRTVEKGFFQRPIKMLSPYIATEHLSDDKKKKLTQISGRLSNVKNG